jgi:hypothetical protein
MYVCMYVDFISAVSAWTLYTPEYLQTRERNLECAVVTDSMRVSRYLSIGGFIPFIARELLPLSTGFNSVPTLPWCIVYPFMYTYKCTHDSYTYR